MPAFKDLNGAFDKKSFDEFRDSIATAGAMRAEFSGVTNADASLAISKLLGGASVSELRQLKFYESNPAVLAFIEQGLTDLGGDIKALSKRELVELTNTALGVSDEVIEASRNSTKGIIAGFKSGLFDKNTGFFGIMRDLDKSAEGTQSVFSSFERIIQKILGENGILSKFVGILKGADIDVDPMQSLADGLGWLGMKIQDLNNWMTRIRAKFDSRQDVDFDLPGLGTKLGAWLASQVNSLFDKTAPTGQGAGTVTAALFNGVGAFLDGIDWAGMSKGLDEFLLNSLGSAIKNISWDTVGTGLILLGVAALGILAKMALAAAMTAAVAAATAISAPVIVMGLAAVAVIGGLALLWKKKGDEITVAIQNFFIRVDNWLVSMLNKLPGKDRAMTELKELPSQREARMFESLANKASGLDQMGLFGAIARERSAMPSGSNLVLANDSEAIFNRQQQAGLLSAIAGGRGGLSIGSLTVNAGTTSDPKQLAKAVMQEISHEWQRFNQQKMSPAF